MYDYGLLNPVWAGTRAAATTSDAAFAQAMLDVEAAWCHAQVNCGTAPESILAAVDASVDVQDYDLAALGASTPDGANALIPLLKALRSKVAERDPHAAGYVHRGATSQDIIDTALMLLTQRTGHDIITGLKTSVGQLLQLADKHAETVMIGRSLDQHAQPISFGFRVSQWVEALGSAGQHFETALTTLSVQWGGAVGTSTWWVDYFNADQPEQDPMVHVDAQRDALAARLGLNAASVWHANRVPILHLGQTAFQIIAAAAKMANDILTAVQAEHGELAEPSAPGRGGSSAMPHKNNPVLSIRLKNAAQTASGHLTALQTGVIANTAERADGGWHTEWAAFRELLRTTGAVVEILTELSAGLQVFPDAMRRNLDIHGNYLMLGRLTGWLGPLVDAHHGAGATGGAALVQQIAQQALTADKNLTQALVAQLPDGVVTAHAIDQMLDPSGYMGGAAAIVAAVQSRYRKWSI